jgi:glutamyl-tRNA(Gln) amidotransferase subunit D
MHASRRDAFQSLNTTPIGRVRPDGRVEFLQPVEPRSRGPVAVDDRLDPKVALIHFHPGQGASEVEAAVQGVHGLVVAGTGLGHVAHDLIPVLARLVRDGVAVVMTTQTLQGRVNLHVYDTGRDLLKAGVLSGEDMLPETALVKLMWVLGHTREPAEVATSMATNVAGELNPAIGLDAFPV